MEEISLSEKGRLPSVAFYPAEVVVVSFYKTHKT